MTKLVLYSNDPRELVGYDDAGRRWDGFYGGGFYRFICSKCGEVKESGWVNYEAVEVCSECAMVVYDMALVGR